MLQNQTLGLPQTKEDRRELIEAERTPIVKMPGVKSLDRTVKEDLE